MHVFMIVWWRSRGQLHSFRRAAFGAAGHKFNRSNWNNLVLHRCTARLSSWFWKGSSSIPILPGIFGMISDIFLQLTKNKFFQKGGFDQTHRTPPPMSGMCREKCLHSVQVWLDTNNKFQEDVRMRSSRVKKVRETGAWLVRRVGELLEVVHW